MNGTPDSIGNPPWLSLYDAGVPARLRTEHASMLHAWAASVARVPEQVAIKYFDGTITVGELDGLSDALAVALAERGVESGDRVAVYLQNIPQFVISYLAVWKAGAIAVSVNPMYKRRELTELLTDSGATALICLESLFDEVARHVLADTPVRTVVTTSELEYQNRNDPRLLGDSRRSRHEDVSGVADMAELIGANRGRRPEPVEPGPDDIAVLTYTSGTTGPPKGAMNTHGNFVFDAQVYRGWLGVRESDVVLGVAPLFHITGLVAHLSLALLTPVTLVLTYRFDPLVVAEAVAEHRATLITGSITVFIALMNNQQVHRDQLASLRAIYSGGAPIPPSTVNAFRERFGHYIYNIYGLTETTSAVLAVPRSQEAPVDAGSGALSVGVPVPDTSVEVVGDDDVPLPVGQVGELVISGGQVVPGYWNNPEETAHALPGGRLHTGDVGRCDERGWFYLVDRKKDQINAAGYKVWPREVEDVLYEHPAVREAAVVGVPDEYRGETVRAFVSLKEGHQPEAPELIMFCRERLAAYKYPRDLRILDELPKTLTGKIVRRALRTESEAGAGG